MNKTPQPLWLAHPNFFGNIGHSPIEAQRCFPWPPPTPKFKSSNLCFPLVPLYLQVHLRPKQMDKSTNILPFSLLYSVYIHTRGGGGSPILGPNSDGWNLSINSSTRIATYIWVHPCVVTFLVHTFSHYSHFDSHGTFLLFKFVHLHPCANSHSSWTFHPWTQFHLCSMSICIINFIHVLLLFLL